MNFWLGNTVVHKLNETSIDFMSVVNTAQRLVSEAMVIVSKIVGPTAIVKELDSQARAFFRSNCEGHHNDTSLRYILERHRERSLSLSSATRKLLLTIKENHDEEKHVLKHESSRQMRP